MKPHRQLRILGDHALEKTQHQLNCRFVRTGLQQSNQLLSHAVETWIDRLFAVVAQGDASGLCAEVDTALQCVERLGFSVRK